MLSLMVRSAAVGRASRTMGGGHKRHTSAASSFETLGPAGRAPQDEAGLAPSPVLEAAHFLSNSVANALSLASAATIFM
jgi:hypothetical protein